MCPVVVVAMLGIALAQVVVRVVIHCSLLWKDIVVYYCNNLTRRTPQ